MTRRAYWKSATASDVKAMPEGRCRANLSGPKYAANPIRPNSSPGSITRFWTSALIQGLAHDPVCGGCATKRTFKIDTIVPSPRIHPDKGQASVSRIGEARRHSLKSPQDVGDVWKGAGRGVSTGESSGSQAMLFRVRGETSARCGQFGLKKQAENAATGSNKQRQRLAALSSTAAISASFDWSVYRLMGGKVARIALVGAALIGLAVYFIHKRSSIHNARRPMPTRRDKLVMDRKERLIIKRCAIIGSALGEVRLVDLSVVALATYRVLLWVWRLRRMR